MFFSSTLLLVAGKDSNNISELYSELVSCCLHDTIKDGRLDIVVMHYQNTVGAVERIITDLYGLARSRATKLVRKNISVTVLLDGPNIDVSRKQSWEVVVVGKYGELKQLNQFFFFFL